MLKNDRIYLRAPEPEDIDFIFRTENDASMWMYSQTISPFSRHALVHYIRTGNGDIYQTKQLRFMIISADNNTQLGMIDIYDFDMFNSKCAIGVIIDPEFQNKGYANDALNLLKDYCLRYLSLNMIYAYVPVDNVPSVKLFKKCGFQSSALVKSWFRYNEDYFDIYIMQLFSKDN